MQNSSVNIDQTGTVLNGDTPIMDVSRQWSLKSSILRIKKVAKNSGHTSYRLEVIERFGKHEILVKGNARLRLNVSPNTSEENRILVLNKFYRTELKQRIPGLLEKWLPVLVFRSKIGEYKK